MFEFDIPLGIVHIKIVDFKEEIQGYDKTSSKKILT